MYMSNDTFIDFTTQFWPVFFFTCSELICFMVTRTSPLPGSLQRIHFLLQALLRIKSQIKYRVCQQKWRKLPLVPQLVWLVKKKSLEKWSIDKHCPNQYYDYILLKVISSNCIFDSYKTPYSPNNWWLIHQSTAIWIIRGIDGEISLNRRSTSKTCAEPVFLSQQLPIGNLQQKIMGESPIHG